MKNYIAHRQTHHIPSATLEALESRRLLSSHHSHALFAAAGDLTAGGRPQGIAVGDFNRDGKLDIVEANSAGPVDVFLTGRLGRFSAVKHYSAGANLSSVAVGDFNRDGFLDLAVTGDDLAILFGKGDGTFGAAVHIAVGNTPQTVIVGRFNADRNLDLAVTNALGDTVSVLLGRGNGRFNSAGTFAAGAGPLGLAAADLNGDGKMDLAVADSGESATGPGAGITILTGAGDGTFSSGGTLTGGRRAVQIVAADLNKDGKPDLITADGGLNSSDGDNTISVLLNNGNAAFKPAVHYAAQGMDPEGIAVGDVTGDGNLDIVASNFNGNGDLAIFAGSATGVLTPLGAIPSSSRALGASVLSHGAGQTVIADLNSDGKLDLASANFNVASVGIILHT